MEPISVILGAAAVGSLAGKITEKVVDYVGDLVRGQDKAAQEAAAQNAAKFLVKFSQTVERMEARESLLIAPSIDAALSDPDVATTVRTAVVGAARTSNEQKQAALARSVVERLMATPESVEAVASNLAVESIPHLSAADLQLLGLAAVVYAIRPPYDILLFSVDPEPQSEGWNPITPYGRWLRSALETNSLDLNLGDLQWIHLAACSCIVYERKLRKDLGSTLLPNGVEILDPRGMIDLRYDLGIFVHQAPIGRDLNNLWEAGLQHCTLTPVGLLIGAAVHEARTGVRVEVPWNYNSRSRTFEVQDLVWDGDRISERFLEVLDRVVKDRAERRVGIWDGLLK
jgi:hypothetical protein